MFVFSTLTRETPEETPTETILTVTIQYALLKLSTRSQRESTSGGVSKIVCKEGIDTVEPRNIGSGKKKGVDGETGTTRGSTCVGQTIRDR